MTRTSNQGDGRRPDRGCLSVVASVATTESDGPEVRPTVERVLEIYDASALVGLKTNVYDVAIERVGCDGETTIELPKLPELLAAAAISRCLMPVRLRGSELRAIRRIMKMTLSDLAKKLDGRTAVETLSRWESEAQPIGAYAERVFRLVACEELTQSAPGIEYSGKAIADIQVGDPWKNDPAYQLPAINLELVRFKEQSGTITDVWDARAA